MLNVTLSSTPSITPLRSPTASMIQLSLDGMVSPGGKRGKREGLRRETPTLAKLTSSYLLGGLRFKFN